MSITATQFKARFTEYAATADARIDIFIADAVALLNETYWGTQYDLGLYYLSAHYLYLADKSAAGSKLNSGPVASKAVDGVSISYTNTTSTDETDDYYRSSAYGQRYLALRGSLGVASACI